MRDMTNYELQLMGKGLCPMCAQKHEWYIKGPSGGLSRNITTQCGVRINILDPEASGLMPWGQVLDDVVPLIDG